MAKNKKLAGGVMTREQWLLKETRIVARMRLDGASEDEVIEKTQTENLFQYPTERMLRNIAGVCNKRIDALDDERLVRIMAFGMPSAAAQTNLYAMMSAYPLMRHFMTTEIARHYRELDYSFTRTDMNAYFTELTAEYESFATIADSTVTKLKSVLRRCLLEAGVLTKDGYLQRVLLDPDFEDILHERKDYAALAAFGEREAL
ncbi:DUF1819 family protein [Gordonibacter sp.]|uniref:DUF1819 family protein n=1 Tax=Gordonibacter sp. TaxID=1968902 RepID=UPI002FC63F68